MDMAGDRVHEENDGTQNVLQFLNFTQLKKKEHE